MRLYFPRDDILQALKGSTIELMLGIPSEQLRNISSNDPTPSFSWVYKYVNASRNDIRFRYIAVGNEVTMAEWEYVLPAMKNIYRALEAAGLQDQIKVSTAVFSGHISATYPPRNSVFNSQIRPFMREIVAFLLEKQAPLLANVYPFFAYLSNQAQIPSEYVFFTSPTVNEIGYQNLFDAMLDGFYYALEKEGGSSLEIVVSETGWPNAGDSISTTENAQKYYSNLIQHVNSGKGTPKRPGKTIETYLFAMFDENQKGEYEREKHFGLFFPNKLPKYDIKLS
uniref:Glucan endo-1,3-beta-glucosidase-like n=1 Tax=Nelumbo nucifera TaxID=4432 RepID=A0A822YAU5_NELNU|nr:TPA_asm: hypothetical protein HUJ06_031015 [Nelumbo nucifera]